MSNAPEFGQAHQALTKAAGQVTAARQELTGDSKTLTDKLSSLQSAWGGQGAAAFFALQQAWTEKQNTIIGALDGFSDSLTQTERKNTAVDEQNNSNLANITSKLG